MLSKRSSSIVTVLAMFAIAGGSKTTAQGKPPAARPLPPVVKPAAPKLPAGDPCQLLTDAEVRQLFPDAQSGRRWDLESAGILNCQWKSPKGGSPYLQLALSDSEPDESIADELKGWAAAFATDGFKWEEALRWVRYETLNNVGDQAMAVVVAPADPQHFLQAGAMLVARRGKRSIRLEAPKLAERGRVPALKALEELGRAAAKRL